MKTFKTAVVIILLIAVLYGVHMVLNKPDALNALLKRSNVAETKEDPLKIDTGMPYDPSNSSSDSSTPMSSQGSMTQDMGMQDFDSSRHDHDLHAKSGPYTAPTQPPPSVPPNDFSVNRQASSTQDDFNPTTPDHLSLEGSPKGTATGVTTAEAFDKDWKKALQQIEDEQYREALETLSVYYDSSDLSSQQESQLLDALDPLAAKVIYSTEHLLESPHVVRRGETLTVIAKQNEVPVKLLQNINGVSNPDVLLPGTKLKIVKGPFRAEVNLQGSKLTLFLGRLYAGQFDADLGQQSPVPGPYSVVGKERGKTYYPPIGNGIAANDESNPYGDWWIGLGGNVSIHSSPASGSPDLAKLGCISLSPRDATDVYGILSKGSKIEVRR